MNIDLLLTLLIQLLSHADEIGKLIRNARAEGRDVTDAELDALAAKDDTAREALQDAINKARGH